MLAAGNGSWQECPNGTQEDKMDENVLQAAFLAARAKGVILQDDVLIAIIEAALAAM